MTRDEVKQLLAVIAVAYPQSKFEPNKMTLDLWVDMLSDLPGEVVAASPKEGLLVRCGDGALQVLQLQAPGGKRMDAKAFLMGKGIEAGTILGRTINDEA